MQNKNLNHSGRILYPEFSTIKLREMRTDAFRLKQLLPLALVAIPGAWIWSTLQHEQDLLWLSLFTLALIIAATTGRLLRTQILCAGSTFFAMIIAVVDGYRTVMSIAGADIIIILLPQVMMAIVFSIYALVIVMLLRSTVACFRSPELFASDVSSLAALAMEIFYRENAAINEFRRPD